LSPPEDLVESYDEAVHKAKYSRQRALPDFSAALILLGLGFLAYAGTLGGGLKMDDINWFALTRDNGRTTL
jgi:hypothetical protein